MGRKKIVVTEAAFSDFLSVAGSMYNLRIPFAPRRLLEQRIAAAHGTVATQLGTEVCVDIFLKILIES